MLTSTVSDSRLLRGLQRLAPPRPLLEAAVALGFGAAVGWRFGWAWAAAAAAAEAGALALASRRPAAAVAALVVAFALPRFESDPYAPFFLRAEDFLVAALCVAALRRRDARPPSTSLDAPIAIFAGLLGLACLAGLAAGTIARPLQSALTVLKHVELLCGFFAAAWAIRDGPARRGVAGASLAAVAVLSAVAVAFLLAHPSRRPFDLAPYRGESNHVGGFAAVACACFLARREPGWRRPLGAGLAILLLVATGSRTAMLGLAAALLVLGIVGRSRAALVLLAGAALLVAVVPAARGRVAAAPAEWGRFVEDEQALSGGFPPRYQGSTRNRFECWALVLDDSRRFPALGTGPGSRNRAFYESQYVMTLGEEGLVGLAALLGLVACAWRSLRRDDTPEAHAALAGLAALVVMGFTCNAFAISRLAGPWWVLAGTALGARREEGG